MAGKSKGRNIFDLSLLKRVFQYAKPYKKKFILSVVMAILLAVVSPIRPWLIQITINEHVQHGAAVTETAKKLSVERAIILITVIQIGLLLLETAFRFYFSYLTAWLGQTVVKDLRAGECLSQNTRA
jgi:ATP-binding cassette, subfamily B, multidrug efflux pump